MTRTRPLATGLLSFSAAAVLALTTAGGVSAAPAPSEDKTTPSVARLAVENNGAADYWTADRMKNAVTGDVLAGAAVERSKRRAPVVESAPAIEKAKVGKVKATKAKAAALTPVKHIGKVFFTMNNSDYVCSGNAVTSVNKSTVATAGHCVIGGPGQEATNFAFVPAYENGVEPYGRWTAKELYTTTEWSGEGDIAYDTAFAVMEPLNGKFLTDVVGGSGVDFDMGRGLSYTSYGYPSAKQFDGQTLKSCTGTAVPDTVNGFETQGIPCEMTSGASGGPWLTGTGVDQVQNSINSYGYSGSKVMYGPYWGPEIEAVYAVASVS